MPAISTCPKCQRQVSIPAGVDSAAVVRCPLCEAEYPLSEALALAPPELIPVVAAASREAAPAWDIHHAALVAAEGEEAQPAEEDEAAAVAQLMPIAATASLRRRQSSWLGKAIGVIVGGLAGCVVGLYALAICYGPQYHTNGWPERVHIEGACDFPLPLIHWLITPVAKPNKTQVAPAGAKPEKSDAAKQKSPTATEPAKEPTESPLPE
jgi:hypothetical protein